MRGFPIQGAGLGITGHHENGLGWADQAPFDPENGVVARKAQQQPWRE